MRTQNEDGESESLGGPNPPAPAKSEAPVPSAAKTLAAEAADKAARLAVSMAVSMADLLPQKHRMRSMISDNGDFKKLLYQSRSGSSPFKIQEEYKGYFSAHHVIPIRRLTYLYNYAFTFLFKGHEFEYSNLYSYENKKKSFDRAKLQKELKKNSLEIESTQLPELEEAIISFFATKKIFIELITQLLFNPSPEKAHLSWMPCNLFFGWKLEHRLDDPARALQVMDMDPAEKVRPLNFDPALWSCLQKLNTAIINLIEFSKDYNERPSKSGIEYRQNIELAVIHQLENLKHRVFELKSSGKYDVTRPLEYNRFDWVMSGVTDSDFSVSVRPSKGFKGSQGPHFSNVSDLQAETMFRLTPVAKAISEANAIVLSRKAVESFDSSQKPPLLKRQERVLAGQMKKAKIKEQQEEVSPSASSEKENLSEAIGQGSKASEPISVEKLLRSQSFFAHKKSTPSSNNEKPAPDSAKPAAD